MDEHCYNEFDPWLDFSKFLEEAKHHATKNELKASSASSRRQSEEETGKKQEKRSKKSWKNTLFSWLKGDKKSKPLVKPEQNSHLPSKRRVHVSGPVYGGAEPIDGNHRRRPTSGPIASLFTPSKAMETQIPYMSLDQLTCHNTVHSYGPVYLVT